MDFRSVMKTEHPGSLLIMMLATFGGLQVMIQVWSTDHGCQEKLQENKSEIIVDIMDGIGKRKGREKGSIERSEKMKRRLKQLCSTLNITVPVTHDDMINILVDDVRKVLFCSMPKVASTNWKRIWLQMIGKELSVFNQTLVREQIHNYLYWHSLKSPRYLYDRWTMLSTYRKFLFVREPFSRVLSAYRDKLQQVTRTERNDFPKYFKRKFTEEFGSNVYNRSDSSVSFLDYMRYILSQRKEHHIYDSHWLSTFKVCNPCAIEYDFIGKFEHLEEDSKHVLKWLEADNVVTSSFPPAIKPTNASELSHHYWNQLPPSLRLGFLKEYALDYLGCDYDFAP